MKLLTDRVDVVAAGATPGSTRVTSNHSLLRKSPRSRPAPPALYLAAGTRQPAPSGAAPLAPAGDAETGGEVHERRSSAMLLERSGRARRGDEV